jgi:hypothetical protein
MKSQNIMQKAKRRHFYVPHIVLARIYLINQLTMVTRESEPKTLSLGNWWSLNEVEGFSNFIAATSEAVVHRTGSM